MTPNMGRDDSLYQPREHAEITEIAHSCGHETDLVVSLLDGRTKSICRECAVTFIRESTGGAWELCCNDPCEDCGRFECVCP